MLVVNHYKLIILNTILKNNLKNTNVNNYTFPIQDIHITLITVSLFAQYEIKNVLQFHLFLFLKYKKLQFYFYSHVLNNIK